MYHINLRQESYQDLPEIGVFDVAVLGGGPAGIAAATVAAEMGLKVILIEKSGFCGGAAVSGMSGTICGLYNSVANPHQPNQKPKQLVHGFAERFKSALYHDGGLTDPQIYGKTWVVTHDCASYKKVATDFLRAAKVQILYHTQMIDVIQAEDQIQALVLATKSGFTRLSAARFIDASGDGDIIFKAGFHTSKGQNGVIQNPSMMFKIGNVDMAAYLAYWGQDTISPAKIVEKLEQRSELIRKKVWLFPTVNPGEILVNGTKITGFDGRALDVTNPVDHSEAEQFAIYQAKAFFEFLKQEVPGCDQAYFIDYGAEVGVRQTRTIEGLARLTNQDVVTARKREDGIVCSSWPIELHYGDKPKTEWLIDQYYDVPFGSLVPTQGRNVIAAGRCLSAEHEALASARVTAQCFEYGRAAAIATYQSLQEKTVYQDLNPIEIAAKMRAN